jgi:hypothetical protein
MTDHGEEIAEDITANRGKKDEDTTAHGGDKDDKGTTAHGGDKNRSASGAGPIVSASVGAIPSAAKVLMPNSESVSLTPSCAWTLANNLFILDGLNGSPSSAAPSPLITLPFGSAPRRSGLHKRAPEKNPLSITALAALNN